MDTTVSLLRGVNVGGRNKIRMEALRRLYETLGFKRVSSYVQSGNVVFCSEGIEINKAASTIQEGVAREFGLSVEVIVRSLDAWRAVVEGNPFLGAANRDSAFMHVTFFAESPRADAAPAGTFKRVGDDQILVLANHAYLYCPNGYARSKLSNANLEKQFAVTATTRNWNTVQKLLEMSQDAAARR